MTKTMLVGLFLASSATFATELNVQPLAPESRYIEIPAQGGPVWKFERGGESIEVARDSQGPDVYRIKFLQQDNKGSRSELASQLHLVPGDGPVVLGSALDSERGMTVYLISVAPR